MRYLITSSQQRRVDLFSMENKREAADMKTEQSGGGDMSQVTPEEDNVEENLENSAAAKLPPRNDTSDESSDEEDDDLILEGVMIRNPEVESSSDEEDSDEDEKPAAKKQKTEAASEAVAKKKTKPATREPDMIQVEFTFNDMGEKFFHGIKTLLHSSSTMYAPDSSALSDLVIANVSVGTVISTEDEEANVYGFASVLNVCTHGSHDCIQRLKKICLDGCPEQHKAEMETVLSGKTKRPAGFLFHGRMINLPLEVVEVLHQQLVLDMDWAVENAEGGEKERKSLDFGAFVRLAPVTPSAVGGLDYKYFDDEVFATNSEFVYTLDAPKQQGSEEKQMCQVIVMTKTGHRQAMKELAKLVSGAS